jgi:hypothetical protein
MTTQRIGLEAILSDVEFTQIQIYANSTFLDAPFDDSIYSTIAFDQSKLNSLIVQIPILFANLEISVLSSSTLLTNQTYQFNQEIPSFVEFGSSQLNFIIYPDSIESTANLIAEVSPPLLIYPETIYFDDILNEYYAVAIETYSSNTLEEFLTATSSSIQSSISFDENIVVRIVPILNSIDSALTFGTHQLNYIINASSIESTEVIGNITQLKMEITDIPFPSIDSTVIFGTHQFNLNLNPSSIENQTIVSEDGQLNQNIELGVWTSSLSLNNSIQLKMEITDVPFPSIESNITIPNPVMKLFIGPLGIGSTENFGTANFIDNIHRLLVFKDDNISKVGTNDAVIIAGGIRLNPSSTIHVSEQLPEVPIGFLSININGTDYKIPYYDT